jgi:Domain of unknown function (DUF222)/HNH endonuclease
VAEVNVCDPSAETVAALAHTPAGPRLSALLATLDLPALTGSQCVDVLRARYRQDSHERGQLFATIAEVMHRTSPDDAAFEQWPGQFAADEVRAALVLTRRASDNLCLLAEDVVRRLPKVQHALAEGVLDQPRARVFSLWTAELSDEHTQAVVDSLLPTAHLLTTAQLIHQIQRHAIALDPNWARRRYEKALRGRRVVGSRNRDGTASLCGYDLPVDQVAAACDRLDRLARSAKKAGHPDPIDHIRSELFLGMTDGSYAGLTDPDILSRLLSRVEGTPTTEPDRAEPNGAKPDAGAEPDSAKPDSTEPAASAEPDGADPTEAEPAASAGPAGAGPAIGPDAGDGGAGGGAARRWAGGLRLLVGLGTLVGVDARPGELAGWGPVHAELARAIAGAPGASWWYVVTGTDGLPLAIGQVRRRPEPTGELAHGCPGAQVWLQVSQATLTALEAQHLPHGWDRVIAEITTKAQADAGPPNTDPAARLPGAALRRWINIRDRTCVFPGCRVPAHRADADHTTEHARGGPTTDDNLGPACRHDHRLRHAGGWRVTQTRLGHFTWTSRLGHTYHRRPPPGLDELPEPTPRPTSGDPDHDDGYLAYLSTLDWRNDRCMQPEPSPPPPQPPPPPPPPPPPASPEDDIPPF